MFRQLSPVFCITICFAHPAYAQEQTDARPSGQQAQEEFTPESLKQKASYLIGFNMIKELKMQEIEIDLDQLLQGINDASAGKQPPMSDEEIRSVGMAFDRQVEKRRQETLARIADDNMRQGLTYLSENKIKDGVIELENGMQYTVLQAGQGDSPRITDSVKIHLTEMFVDGTVVRTTAGSQPINMTVGAWTRGVSEALQKMKVGEKWKLVVPSDLAYGVQGNPPVVGPNQVLIYDLELVEIIK